MTFEEAGNDPSLAKLDVAYFKEKLSLLARDIDNYTAEEAAREFARLANTADKNIFLEDEFNEHGKRTQAIVMSNARRLIKANKITSNTRLYSELYGTGSGTAYTRCRFIGLDPDSNVTDYTEMMKSLDKAYP